MQNETGCIRTFSGPKTPMTRAGLNMRPKVRSQDTEMDDYVSTSEDTNSDSNSDPLEGIIKPYRPRQGAAAKRGHSRLSLLHPGFPEDTAGKEKETVLCQQHTFTYQTSVNQI